MFCSKCGTQLNEDAKFCNNCGERIITNSTQNNETFQNNTPNVENTESNKKSFFEKFKKFTEVELEPEERKKLLDNHNKYLAAFFHLKEPPTNYELKELEKNDKRLNNRRSFLSFLIKGISNPNPYGSILHLFCPYLYLFQLGAYKSAIIITIIHSLSLFGLMKVIKFRDMSSGWDFLGMMLCIFIPIFGWEIENKINMILFKRRMKKVENEKSEEEKLAKFKSLCPDKDKYKKLTIMSFACWTIFLIISLFTFRGSGKYIDLVKNGAFRVYPNITIEELINGAMHNPKWKQGQTEDGINFVNVSGLIEGNKVVIQFKIDKNENSFGVNALEVNGQPRSTQGIEIDLYSLYIANK
ncbi:zinc ribbon domain-containing protein [Brachyspira aalborgi]|uniref:Zinc ribbon domain-containing protein n=1 Tax=Brachyspira aalborgi TaxID=29522 RepID=A0A5C8DB84_9SPIR|nr:zinc ribbon domain-containing protein [Brachyspira aalborgi]TXJ21661.1 zinc ribbon domain-containing protein [Brachyspira aalborgi]